MIDLDEISLVHPNQGRSFARENLRAIWPRYAAVAGLRLLLPGVIADEEELVLLRDALPGANLAVCELTAPETVLKERVTAREPNEFWREGLRGWVGVYHARNDLDKIRDFLVSTHERPEEDAARQVIEKVGWAAARHAAGCGNALSAPRSGPRPSRRRGTTCRATFCHQMILNGGSRPFDASP